MQGVNLPLEELGKHAATASTMRLTTSAGKLGSVLVTQISISPTLLDTNIHHTSGLSLSLLDTLKINLIVTNYMIRKMKRALEKTDYIKWPDYF